MNRILNLVSIVGGLLLLVAPALAAHDFEGQCESCHLSDPSGGELIFVDSIDTLCRNCHDILGMNVHPSELTPSMTMPEGFWLDAGGRFNCATCHDPHPAETESHPFMLRSAVAGTDFCKLCHDVAVSDDGRHLAAVFVAHNKTPSTTSPKTGEQLDDISSACASCHDGSAAQMAMFCVLGQEGQCTSHILGLDYEKTSAANPELNPASELSPFITLYEGKIGCLSCHSIYSHETTQLVISNQSSQLCTNCHQL